MTDQPDLPLQAHTPQSQPSASTPNSAEPLATSTRIPINPRSSNPAIAAWNTRKFQEEYELARSKFTDKRFDIRDYHDPLLPRAPSELPKGMTAERAQHLRDLKAKIESSRV
ncbi:hypothetical protein NKR23_g55 [Pleurostoma richardsiae]|uniref:Uncharacterized protein n=1 Tax=Pleurostoma richardsiae TaxID=41990 RepID=A0AA38RTI0_9PEZI|nr:hypothetical protein NKR23_g55 [Pleurostoma richardsiae]